MHKSFIKFLDTLDIKLGEKLYIASDITQILIFHKKNKEEFKPNDLINYFLEKIGKKGTLIFPTFNWDFCRGIPFDYSKTPSRAGSLTRIALTRKDFIRTKHPIYSFVVKGFDQDILYELDDESGWGSKSLFKYFHENNAKNLFIGIDYKNGFTFDHYFEEKVGVDYRYFKYFSADYIDRYGNKEFKKYKMYVRDLDKNIVTAISHKMDDVLKKKKAYKKFFFENIYFGLIEMKISGDIMLDDLKKQGGLIYQKKI
tara:strand:+ start:6731 stop:7498 length:768 start_codon:yes stop_codon:yes gene_type:complete